eukprot:11175154-Lingulodinium_polyedra.AAC.1
MSTEAVEATPSDDPWAVEPCQVVARPSAQAGTVAVENVKEPPTVIVAIATPRPAFLLDVVGAGYLAWRSAQSTPVVECRGRA